VLILTPFYDVYVEHLSSQPLSMVVLNILTSKKQTTMARKESKRVMVLRGLSARKARNAFTLWVLLPVMKPHGGD